MPAKPYKKRSERIFAQQWTGKNLDEFKTWLVGFEVSVYGPGPGTDDDILLIRATSTPNTGAYTLDVSVGDWVYMERFGSLGISKKEAFQNDFRALEWTPAVGRTVHFHSYNEKGQCPYAAMITQINADGTVELATFGPNSVYFQHNVKFSHHPKPNHWSWPNQA